MNRLTQVLFLAGLLAVAFLLTSAHLTKAQNAPLCLDSQSHLIWAGTQSQGNIPVRSNMLDTISRSALKWVTGLFTIGSFTEITGTEIWGPLRLAPIRATQVQNPQPGMIYYDL